MFPLSTSRCVNHPLETLLLHPPFPHLSLNVRLHESLHSISWAASSNRTQMQTAINTIAFLFLSVATPCLKFASEDVNCKCRLYIKLDTLDRKKLWSEGSEETRKWMAYKKELSGSSCSLCRCFVVHCWVTVLSCTDGGTSGRDWKSIQVKGRVHPSHLLLSLWGQDSEISMTTFLKIAWLWSGIQTRLAKPNSAEMWDQREVGNALIRKQLLAVVPPLQAKVLGLAATCLEKL